MKKLFSFLLCSFLAITSFSQINWDSLGFNYYALVRDTAGRVQVSKPVKMKFTLLLGKNGSVVNSPWIESHTTSTDAYGFVDVTVGGGNKEGGTATKFSDVDFGATNIWILIEVFNTSTQAYEVLNKQALQAVPYAKVAGSLAGGASVPPGTIVAFGGDIAHIPNGWLLCDGRELDNSDPKYQALFNAIQYNWGTPNHTNKFHLPYTLGLFLRGVSNGNINIHDPDRDNRVPTIVGGNAGDNVGSFQLDALAKHDHTITSAGSRSGRYAADPGTLFFSSSGDCCDYGPKSVMTNPNINLNAETRPVNVYVNYIIKL